MRTASATLLALFVSLAVVPAAQSYPAQGETITIVKRCGSITDPKIKGEKVRVNITQYRSFPCSRAKKVIREYLKQVPVPRESTGENVFDIRVDKRKWSCSVTRYVGGGRQLDYGCSQGTRYSVSAGPV